MRLIVRTDTPKSVGRQHGVALFEFDPQGEPEAKSEAARRLLRASPAPSIKLTAQH
jgi:hypothetical protein